MEFGWMKWIIPNAYNIFVFKNVRRKYDGYIMSYCSLHGRIFVDFINIITFECILQLWVLTSLFFFRCTNAYPIPMHSCIEHVFRLFLHFFNPKVICLIVIICYDLLISSLMHIGNALNRLIVQMRISHDFKNMNSTRFKREKSVQIKYLWVHIRL